VEPVVRQERVGVSTNRVVDYASVSKATFPTKNERLAKKSEGREKTGEEWLCVGRLNDGGGLTGKGWLVQDRGVQHELTMRALAPIHSIQFAAHCYE
jgi:hypothetical protein